LTRRHVHAMTQTRQVVTLAHIVVPLSAFARPGVAQLVDIQFHKWTSRKSRLTSDVVT
jgi:hypothetical protein